MKKKPTPATKAATTPPPPTPTPPPAPTPPFPPPGPDSVGQMIIDYLTVEGVTHVFGIPGGGLMNLLVSLKNNDSTIKYIICRQETGAAYMADGYYRATGKLGVVAVTTGPGATNALTGLMNAQAGGSAVMLITGEIDQKYTGKGFLQEGDGTGLNIQSIYEEALGYSQTISEGQNAETLFKQALRNALATPRQAVHLSLPLNVTDEPYNVGAPAVPKKPSAYRAVANGANFADVKLAFDALVSCKRPLLFLGNGCRIALEDQKTYNNFVYLVETLGIPVMTTADAKGIFSEAHAMSLRVYGIANCMWPYYYLNAKDTPYDGVMIIGSAMDQLSTNTWNPMLVPQGKKAPFIQVDINEKMIARSFDVTHGLVCEAGSFINELATMARKYKPGRNGAQTIRERKNAIALIKRKSPYTDPAAYKSKNIPVEPAALMGALQKVLPAKSKIFIDAGNCVGWSVHYLTIKPPTSIFTCLAMGPMGFAVGAVVGGKIGCPDYTCFAITGDGAFLMQGSEVSTAARYGIGAIWIVLFDNRLSMVNQGMTHFFDPKKPDVWDNYYQIGKPDLAVYAKGLGADAYDIKSVAEFEKIMPKVLENANKKNKPQVIVAHINQDAIPPYYYAFDPKK